MSDAMKIEREVINKICWNLLARMHAHL